MTSDNRDYYQILGVPSDASFEDIRAAFRERARDYHPDRNPSPDAVERHAERSTRRTRYCGMNNRGPRMTEHGALLERQLKN